MADTPLTLHDHLLAHALTALVAQRRHDARREALWLGLLRDALPRVSRRNRRVAALCAVAEKLLERPEGGARIAAHLEAAAALVAWSEWRIGQVQDGLQKDRAA